MKKYNLFINGQWQEPASGEYYQRICPASGKAVNSHARATADETQMAIIAARKAFDCGPWPKLSAMQRGEVLIKAADMLRKDKERLAEIITKEVGKPLSQARGEVNTTANLFQYAAHLAMDLHGESYQINGNYDAVIVREPIGVVGAIVPWNFPLMIMAFKAAPALAIGCTVVCKPAELTSGIAFEMAEILNAAGLPKGVLNVVSGRGSVVGAEIARSELVDKVTFTGSTIVGKEVMQAAANNTKRVSLELGGKSPHLVFDDVIDIDMAVDAAVEGMFFNQGEVCDGGTRLLLQNSIHDIFMEKLIAKVKRIRVGDPMKDVDMGAIISKEQFDTVMNYIEIGKKEAALVCGGNRLSGEEYNAGYFIEPTIFDKVPQDARIAQEEIFGPVLVVQFFDTEEEAIELANNSIYGLASGLWSKDIYRAIRVAKALRTGSVYINDFGMGSPQLPFGGYKQSGVGREKGMLGMNEYTQMKTIHIQSALKKDPWIK